MKNIFLSFMILALAKVTTAQNLHVNVFAGLSNYQGGFQTKNITFDESHPAVGVGVLYELNGQLFLRGNFKLGKISGDDKNGSLNKQRNLNFASSITDIELGLEYDIFNLYERSLTPYVFAGIAGFHFNPYSHDSANNKVYLQPLGTEGQGFYLGRKKYALTQIAIPFGGGLKFALNEDVRIKFEIGFRKTFTDYLDDVSSTYADKNELLINNGQQAVDFAFRENELKPTLSYPAAGTRRGNPGSKDWYYFTGFSISYRLAPHNGSLGNNKSKLGCPVSIY